MIQLLIFFLLFLIQFVYFPIGASFFEGAKVIVAEMLISSLLIFHLYSKNGLKYKNLNKIIVGSLAVLIILSAYHLIDNQSQTILFGNQFRLQGTLLLWFLVAFSVLSSGVSIEEKIKPWVISVLLLFQFIFSVMFIGVGVDRPIGTMGEPNALATTTIFLWPFLFFPTPKKRTGWIIALGGFMLSLLIILVSGSRSGVIALGIQIIFLFFTKLSGKKLIFPTIMALIILFVSYAVPVFFSNDKYENRSEIWQSAFVAGSKSPIMGVGFGNAETVIHSATVKLNNHLQGYYIDSAHNIFLDWFVSGGIIGLLILLFLIFYTFRYFISRHNIRNISLLLGMIACLSFNPASVVSLLAFWWLIGQGALNSEKL